MRVLFWNHCYLPRIGGVEIFTARLASGLIARGHRAAVIAARDAPDQGPREMIDGVEVERFDFAPALSPSPDRIDRPRMKAVETAVAVAKRRFRPDIVHINLADAAPFFHLRTAAAWPAPTLITMQAAFSRAVVPGSVTARLLDTADPVVAVSGPAAQNIARWTGWPVQRIRIVPPGIPADDFVAARATAPPSIVFLGRLVPEKGADVAIRALARLGSDPRLVLIGDGPERPALEALAQQLGLASRVHFCGAVDDAERARLLSRGFALLVPSLHEELFGMVAVEGALSGLPVIASATGGLAEIVDDGATGFLVGKGDDEAMAARLASLLADQARARTMGQAGRDKALRLYTIERTVAAYEALYRESIGRHAQARTA